MPFSTRLRFDLQDTGSNQNVWGSVLNTRGLQRIDDAICGLATIALTGDYTLTTSNLGAEDARYAVLKFTGGAGPFTVTIPSLEKIYKLWNAASGDITVTTGSGDTVIIEPGDVIEVFCDATNVKTLAFGGSNLKDYIASVVVGGGATLPSLVGSAGKWLTSNGTIALWANPTTSDLTDYASDQTTRAAALKKFAFVMALTF